MSKYAALWAYVAGQPGDALRLSFGEAEAHARVPLDHSFLQAKKELPALGWQVDKISLKARTVSFSRLKSAQSPPGSGEPKGD